MDNNTSNQSHVTNRPFDANDDEPYIFISYKHSDWKKVYPIINKFHDAGFNIWYDASLTKGKYYDIQIANHIKKSSLFVTFITQTVIDSSSDEEDYLIKELNVAKETKRKRLPIFLDNVELDGFYLMHYSGKQSILKYEYEDNEDLFIKECIRTFREDFGIEPNTNLITAPCPVYDGNDSYIYISYAQEDMNYCVSDIIKRFYNLGYNMWYNINEPKEVVENKIINSSLFVIFISHNSIESSNVRDMIYIAVDNEIPILQIYLEESELKYGLQLIKGKTILKYKLSEDEFINSCINYFEEKGFILSSNNFEYLNYLINCGNQKIILQSDFIFDEGNNVISLDEDLSLKQVDSIGKKFEKGIEIINKNITIDGNGHSIDAKGKARIFNITESIITLKNITFKNGKTNCHGGAILNNEGKINLINCKFKNNNSIKEGTDISNGYNSIVMIEKCDFLPKSNKCSIWNLGEIWVLEGEEHKISSLPVSCHLITAPFEAYNGDDYIYVSYAHVDADEVYKDIEEFNKDKDINIWYDMASEVWPEIIQNKIECCSAILVFVSDNSIESFNVRNEINFAFGINKPCIPIYLNETELKYGLGLTIGNIQPIFKNTMKREDYINNVKKRLKRIK